jgi:hypothetical protein
MKIIVKCNPIYFLWEKNRKLLTNRDGNLILIREHGSLLAAKGGKEKAGPRVKERLSLIERRSKRMAWDLVVDAAGSIGPPRDTREIRKQYLSERE